MKKQVEKLAKTIDEAIEDALVELQVDYDEVIIEVLDEGDSGGLLGFGRRPARVRVTLAEECEKAEAEENRESDYVPDLSDQAPPFLADDADEDTSWSRYHNEDFANSDYARDELDSELDAASEDDLADDYEDDLDDYDSQDDDYASDRRRSANRKRPGRQAYSEADREKLEERAVEFVATVLQNLEIHGRISSFFADDGALHIEVEGDNLGNAIGRQGETLYALQYLTTLVINQDHTRYQRLALDIDHYCERRMRHLRQQARRSAERVLKSGRRYVMKPMNAAERRQVHLALADFQGIVTYSEGREPKRSVVIDRDEEY